jgi:hypothetical protein
MNRNGARLKPTALIILSLVLAHRAIAVEVLEDVVEQRHSLAPDGTLSIQNIDGSIQIYGGLPPRFPSRRSRRLTAVKG